MRRIHSGQTYLTTCSVTADDPRQRLVSNDMIIELKDVGRFALTAGNTAIESFWLDDGADTTLLV